MVIKPPPDIWVQNNEYGFLALFGVIVVDDNDHDETVVDDDVDDDGDDELINQNYPKCDNCNCHFDDTVLMI